MKRNKLISIASAAAFVGMGIAAAIMAFPYSEVGNLNFMHPLVFKDK